MNTLTRLAAVCSAAVIGFGTATITGTNAAPTLHAYDSGSNSERVTRLPITKFGSPMKRTVVQCVVLEKAPTAGEIIQTTSDFQVTNDQGYLVHFANQTLLTDSCTNHQGLEITEGAGYNCDPPLHHCPVNRTGLMVMQGNTYRRFVVTVAWSTTTKPEWTSGDYLVVQPDYGRLSVLRWR